MLLVKIIDRIIDRRLCRVSIKRDTWREVYHVYARIGRFIVYREDFLDYETAVEACSPDHLTEVVCLRSSYV